MINDQHAIEMIDFVLEADGQQSFGLQIHRLSMPVHTPNLDPCTPFDISSKVDNAQA